MKCPIDKTEMKKGGLRGYGGISFRKSTGFWNLKLADPFYVYYCPKCGKIELATEPD